MANRLAHETSPYLRDHADDPVDWYPWGDEAFARARELNRPIFLSLGYASCHWCHVMHWESFSDPTTAEQLNNRFVPIKVDRESRPDIDEVYMAYVVASRGRGGWPMSVFLTPQLLPVYGGTYFPPEAAYNMPSFRNVLDQVSTAFADDPQGTQATAEKAVEYLKVMFARPRPGEVSRAMLHRSADTVLSAVDPVHGGFDGAPKFPQAPMTDFLLAFFRLTGDGRALEAAECALSGMIRGGIFDQAGGGIARYAVDDRWLVPHFEKMLYDNAQLLSTLAALHSAHPDGEWVHAMRATAEFMERDLATGVGTYTSSLSADTSGEEGATYVWSRDDLERVLTRTELRLAEAKLGVTATGNWEGRNILTRVGGRDRDTDAVDTLLRKLLAERQRRAQPDTDTKVLVSWNALAAHGLIAAGTALGDDALLDRGVNLVRRLLDEAVCYDGGVKHLLGDAPSERVRLVEDAAALALAVADAHATTGDGGFALAVSDILTHAEKLFAERGVWYMTPADTELPVRPREQHDSPTPMGSSLAALALIRISRAGGKKAFRQSAQRILAHSIPIAERSPFAAGTALAAMCELLEEQ